MKIGIIGSGVVGQTLGIGFLKNGHQVKIGTREPGKLKEWREKNKTDNASVGNFKDAAEFGELIVLCTLWTGTKNAVELSGMENFKGKILIDVTNPLDFSEGMPPKLGVNVGHSGGEQIQSWLPNTKVVKAFNIINAYTMINPNLEEGKPDLFICGNDADAKKKVTDIAKEFNWESIIDIGGIKESFLLEALTILWVNYGFKHNQWTHAFKLLKK